MGLGTVAVTEFSTVVPGEPDKNGIEWFYVTFAGKKPNQWHTISCRSTYAKAVQSSNDLNEAVERWAKSRYGRKARK